MRGSSATALRLVFIADRRPYSIVYRPRPSLSGRRCSYTTVYGTVCQSTSLVAWTRFCAPSMGAFRSRLKCHFFSISFPSNWLHSARAV